MMVSWAGTLDDALAIQPRLSPTLRDVLRPRIAESHPESDRILALNDTLRQGEGLFTDRFAFCQSLALSDALKVHELVRKKGLAVRRFRPYLAPLGEVLVAAAWVQAGDAAEDTPDITGIEIEQHR